MKQEKGRYITLTPNEGMVLYNGKVLSSKAYLPLTADVNVWQEITEEKAEEIRKAQESANPKTLENVHLAYALRE